MTTRFQLLKIWVKYVWYYMNTQDERLAYQVGQSRGMHVSSIKTDAFGSSVTYDKNKKPVRNYLNWVEFKVYYLNKEI